MTLSVRASVHVSEAVSDFELRTKFVMMLALDLKHINANEAGCLLLFV